MTLEEKWAGIGYDLTGAPLELHVSLPYLNKHVIRCNVFNKTMLLCNQRLKIQQQPHST